MLSHALIHPMKSEHSTQRIMAKAVQLPVVLLMLSLGGCGSDHKAEHKDQGIAAATSPVTQALGVKAALSPMAEMGRRLFFEPRLSASGHLACASCHDPAFAFGSPGQGVQRGGADMMRQGFRMVPSLTYSRETPFFTLGESDDDDEEGHIAGAIQFVLPDQVHAARHPIRTPQGDLMAHHAKEAGHAPNLQDLVPQGGLFWDGRANTLQAQALGPLLNPMEMANPSKAALLKHIYQLPYLAEIRRLAGPATQTDEELLSQILYMMSRYQAEEPKLAQFDSKYDHYLQGKATLTAAEARGLRLFDDPAKGNCAACHLDKPRADGRPPLFTDFEFEALGVPRNPAIVANRNPAFYDLGLCGPVRRDHFAANQRYCGMFKTPSLRNVALKKSFFHNGVYHDLKDVVRFYVYRDTQPARIYPVNRAGQVDKFNDLPRRHQRNIDITDAPLNLHAGDTPPMTEAEMDDVVAYLSTLTDDVWAHRSL